MISDRDVLQNLILASHEYRTTRIDAQEELLTSGIISEQESVVRSVQKGEVARNRNRVSEILHIVDRTNAEIELAEDNA